jgi:hypothetical protein
MRLKRIRLPIARWMRHGELTNGGNRAEPTPGGEPDAFGRRCRDVRCQDYSASQSGFAGIPRLCTADGHEVSSICARNPRTFCNRPLLSAATLAVEPRAGGQRTSGNQIG